MSYGFNQITLTGNLVSDAELSSTNNGTSIANFTLAVNGKDDAVFMLCTAFGGIADVVAKYTNKGSSILVSGRMAQDNWTNKEGKKQTKYKVIVDKVQLLGSPKGKKNNVATETIEGF